jgi:MFS superfamily sulfate permease-like transporter
MGMYKQGKDQFIPFLITVVTILLTDLLIGIGVGMAFAVFFILRNNLKYSHFLEQDVKKDGTHYTIKLAQEVSFLNKAAIIKALEEIPREAKVTIDGSKSALIDHDVLEAIEEFVKLTAPSRDIQVSTMGLSKNKVIDSV